jgi:hypothetical protein
MRKVEEVETVEDVETVETVETVEDIRYIYKAYSTVSRTHFNGPVTWKSTQGKPQPSRLPQPSRHFIGRK